MREADPTSCDVLSQDDIDSASDKIDVATSSGNVTLIMTLDLGAAERLISREELQTLEGQLTRDIARGLRVPYRRIEVSGIQRNQGARAMASRCEDASQSSRDSMKAEWAVRVILLHPCEEPARSADSLLQHLLVQCRNESSFLEETGIQRIAAIYCQGCMLWTRLRNSVSESTWNTTQEESAEAPQPPLDDGIRDEGGIYTQESYQVLDVVSQIQVKGVHSRTWTVSCSSKVDSDFSRICDALANCREGDTIVVGSGEYHEDICFAMDKVTLVSASAVPEYYHLNMDHQPSTNACWSVPSEKLLLDPLASMSDLTVLSERDNHETECMDEGQEDAAIIGSASQGDRKRHTVLIYGDAKFHSPTIYCTAKYTCIDSIQVLGKCRAGAIEVGAGDLHLRNVVVSRATGDGLIISPHAVGTLSRCAIVACHGAALVCAGYSRIEKCFFADCRGGGVIIKGPRSANCQMSCVRRNGGIGILSHASSNEADAGVFEGNVIQENGEGGVLVSGLSRSRFSRNVIAGNTDFDMSSRDDSAPILEGNKIQVFLASLVYHHPQRGPALFFECVNDRASMDAFAGNKWRWHAISRQLSTDGCRQRHREV